MSGVPEAVRPQGVRLFSVSGWLSGFHMNQNHREGSLNLRSPATPRVSDSAGLGCGPRMCPSGKFQVMRLLLAQEPHFEKVCLAGTSAKQFSKVSVPVTVLPAMRDRGLGVASAPFSSAQPRSFM